jgi:hypothetical protein
MASWIVKRGELQRNVADVDALREFVRQKRVRANDLVCNPATGEWRAASDTAELRDAFAALGGGQAVDVPQDVSSAAITPVENQASAPPPLSLAAQALAVGSDFVIRQGKHEFRAPDIRTLRIWADEGRVYPDSYVFHPVLNRWSYARELAELEPAYQKRSTATQVAASYRQLVLWVGGQIVVSLGALIFGRGLLSLLLAVALLVTIIALSIYAYRTADALGSSAAPLWAVAMLVPCINIITLLVLSSKATEVCRANGIPVGFLGPRVP